jgi:enoyl-CoA hydratase
MTKRFLTAQEAFDWGIVAKVVPPENLMQAAMEMAGEINKMPPLSIRAIKKAINHKTGNYEHSRQVLSELQQTEDAKEGTRAFLEKRAPQFKGI